MIWHHSSRWLVGWNDSGISRGIEITDWIVQSIAIWTLVCILVCEGINAQEFPYPAIIPPCIQPIESRLRIPFFCQELVPRVSGAGLASPVHQLSVRIKVLVAVNRAARCQCGANITKMILKVVIPCQRQATSPCLADIPLPPTVARPGCSARLDKQGGNISSRFVCERTGYHDFSRLP